MLSKYTVFGALFTLSLSSCEISSVESAEKPADFSEYWYQGKAEITSYNLTQARYGELHSGKAVLVFVTEPFSPSQHVKVDNPANHKDAVSVLKLNHTRKFNTGIYPYSLMTSSFTPVDGKLQAYPLKISFSGQEWCGHAYSQLELSGKKYDYVLHSYFESDAHETEQIDVAISEDGVFNLIRIDPGSLPVGSVKIIPALSHLRLMHKEMKAYDAKISIETKGKTQRYSLDYSGLDRSISVDFNTQFPHQIIGWTETYTSGWGDSAKKLTTTATLDKTLFIDYWNKNSLEDANLRKELGLQ